MSSVNSAEIFVRQALERRAAEHSLRTLVVHPHRADFCSNDYLGFSRSANLKQRLDRLGREFPSLPIGSTGSRLISGNSELTEDVECRVSAFHGAQSGLIFNSGYDANVGLFSSVPQRGDTVIYDSLIHASVRDGVRLSRAERVSFRHNDPADLREKLKTAAGRKYVAVESVYSMDGDRAPLEELIQVCGEMEADLIVDEAHATGVLGPGGRGAVSAAGLERSVFARVHTFGKALGTHGAIVLGSENLRQYLINFARSLIYSTALPPHSVLAIRASYEEVEKADADRSRLQANIQLFQALSKENKLDVLHSDTPIQGLIVAGNVECRTKAEQLQEAGLDVRAILYPSVPRGAERLRITLHSFNTEEEIRLMILTLARGK